MDENQHQLIFIESDLEDHDLREIISGFHYDTIETLDVDHIEGTDFLSSLTVLIPSAVIVKAIRDVLLEHMRSRTSSEKDSKVVRIHHGDIYYEGPASNLPLILESIFGKKANAD